MSFYNPEVKIALDKLCDLKSAADCLSIVRKERDDAKAATARRQRPGGLLIPGHWHSRFLCSVVSLG